MTTWTSQEGNSLSRSYFSAAAWGGQLVLERSLAPDRVPWIIRGRTLDEQHARFPDGAATPDRDASYCGACGLLVVALNHHKASARHQAATRVEEPASPQHPAAARVELADVEARMRADPAFAAAILASAAAGAGLPAGAASASRQIEFPGAAVGGIADVSAPRAAAVPEAGSPAPATSAAEAAEFLEPSGGALAAGFAPRSADLAVATPMELSLEAQEPTDLLKLLDAFTGR